MNVAPEHRCEARTAKGLQCRRAGEHRFNGRNVCGGHKLPRNGFAETARRLQPVSPKKGCGPFFAETETRRGCQAPAPAPSKTLKHAPRVVAPRGTIERVMHCATSQLSESLKRHASEALREINELGAAFNADPETPAQGVAQLEALLTRCHGISDRLRWNTNQVGIDLEVLAHAAGLDEGEAS